MSAHDFLDSLRRLIGMVERDCADVVVKNMCLNDTVQELSTDKTEFSIDRCGGSSSVRPALRGVVGERRIGVLQISDGHQPVVDPQIWQAVPHKHVEPAKCLAKGEEDRSYDGKPQVAQHNKLSILCLVQRAAGVEVVDATQKTVLLAPASSLSLVFVVVVASDVGDDIHWPSSKLLSDKIEKSCNWCFLSQLVELVSEAADPAGKLISCLWHEYHVPFHVASGFMVLPVRDFPREIWH